MIKNYKINKVDAPFLVFPPKKKYILVLDLCRNFDSFEIKKRNS